jgi:hypothetical protein
MSFKSCELFKISKDTVREILLWFRSLVMCGVLSGT